MGLRHIFVLVMNITEFQEEFNAGLKATDQCKENVVHREYWQKHRNFPQTNKMSRAGASQCDSLSWIGNVPEELRILILDKLKKQLRVPEKLASFSVKRDPGILKSRTAREGVEVRWRAPRSQGGVTLPATGRCEPVRLCIPVPAPINGAVTQPPSLALHECDWENPGKLDPGTVTCHSLGCGGQGLRGEGRGEAGGGGREDVTLLKLQAFLSKGPAHPVLRGHCSLSAQSATVIPEFRTPA